MSNDVFKDIQDERTRQNEKWGVQNHDDSEWMLILMEEVGEVANALLSNDPAEHIETELIQCAAVIAAWVECRRRNR